MSQVTRMRSGCGRCSVWSGPARSAVQALFDQGVEFLVAQPCGTISALEFPVLAQPDTDLDPVRRGPRRGSRARSWADVARGAAPTRFQPIPPPPLEAMMSRRRGGPPARTNPRDRGPGHRCQAPGGESSAIVLASLRIELGLFVFFIRSRLGVSGGLAAAAGQGRRQERGSASPDSAGSVRLNSVARPARPAPRSAPWPAARPASGARPPASRWCASPSSVPLSRCPDPRLPSRRFQCRACAVQLTMRWVTRPSCVMSRRPIRSSTPMTFSYCT